MDETKRLLLVQQERPSVREAFYDIAAEKQTLEGYVTCLRRCNTFPADYKYKYLERYEYNRERKIAIMALLGMMDPRRPSKDIETKRRRNRNNNLFKLLIFIHLIFQKKFLFFYFIFIILYIFKEIK